MTVASWADERRGRRLSPREVQVLAALAAGHTTKRIAADLTLSERTIQVYRRSVLAKLNADSMPHAVAIAVSRGLIHVLQGSGQ